MLLRTKFPAMSLNPTKLPPAMLIALPLFSENSTDFNSIFEFPLIYKTLSRAWFFSKFPVSIDKVNNPELFPEPSTKQAFPAHVLFTAFISVRFTRHPISSIFRCIRSAKFIERASKKLLKKYTFFSLKAQSTSRKPVPRKVIPSKAMAIGSSNKNILIVASSSTERYADVSNRRRTLLKLLQRRGIEHTVICWAPEE
ncbi:hypothetical protein P5673_009473 [Acropora cervicornis]|uniref:Uncharacterized protein n=1 Tax=Acropora cervicornis TaxID=6130 RepID=A0AAD9VAC7_ACRCE|nr:hypothetical protein P5673_009473 [Acropora cervicornis]